MVGILHEEMKFSANFPLIKNIRIIQTPSSIFFSCALLIIISLQELSDIQHEYEQYKEEMADVTETVEMATLDKEMAEEKVKVKIPH